MINLSNSQYISAGSSVSNISYSLSGYVVTGVVEDYRVLSSGFFQPTKVLYTAFSGTVISVITMTNLSTLDTTVVTVSLNGGSNIFQGTLDPLWSLTADTTGWKIYDENGVLITSTRLQDGSGNALTSTGGSLNVNVTSILAPLIPVFAFRSDTYTAVGSGTIINVSTSPVKYYAIQVNQTGAVTSWDVRLEGSLDGVNFTSILAHTNVIGDGQVVYIGALTASNLYFRSRCNAITLGAGTGITVVILGTV